MSSTSIAVNQASQSLLFSDRSFRYWLIAPAVLIILLVGLFPIIYSLVVSVQNITLMDQDYSWYGFIWYEDLWIDERFWESLWHTGLITIIALPTELILGLLLARMFLGEMKGKPIFIAILVLPAVICPVVVGAMWRLMFDTRYGPITHILSWFTDTPIVVG